jgi:hypothetical protein
MLVSSGLSAAWLCVMAITGSALGVAFEGGQYRMRIRLQAMALDELSSMACRLAASLA